MMKKNNFKFSKIAISLLGLSLLAGCHNDSNDTSSNKIITQENATGKITPSQQTSSATQLRQVFKDYQHATDSLDQSHFGQVNDGMANAKQNLEQLYLKKINTIDKNTLSDEDKVYYGIFKYDRNITIQGLLFPNQLFGSYETPITHFNNNIEYFAEEAGQKRKNIADYQQQLKILKDYTAWVTNLQSKFQQGENENIELPKVLISRLLSSTKDSVSKNDYQILKQGLNDILINPNKFNKPDNFIVEYQKTVNDAINATDSLINYLAGDYYNHARGTNNVNDKNIGWGTLPNGQDWYQWHLNRNSTTGKTADELHQLGTKLVADAKAEMKRVAKFIASKEGNKVTAKWRNFDGKIIDKTFVLIDDNGQVNLNEFFAYLNSEKFFYGRDGKTITTVNQYQNLCKTASQQLVCQTALVDYNKFKNDANHVVTHYFNPIKTDYTIVPIAASHEKYDGVASYNDNHFNLNTNPNNSLQKWSVSTLLLHEAAPGHHFQHAYSLEYPAKHKPNYINDSSYTSYAEGWALYTEWLGVKMGIYGELNHNDKPSFKNGQGMCKPDMDYSQFQGGVYKDAEECNALQYFGSLNEAQLRNMRLAVDTGIHAKGWSIQQAREYMHNNSALGQGDIESESFRYAAYVGQAVAYKSGFLIITDLLNKAQAALGEQFKWADFHDQILKYGDQPMEVLQSSVELWINNQSK